MTDTTWGYRFQCPECGYGGVTQDPELRDAMVEWHNDRAHGGAEVCESHHDEQVPVAEFPADEDPEVPAESGGEEVVTLG